MNLNITYFSILNFWSENMERVCNMHDSPPKDNIPIHTDDLRNDVTGREQILCIPFVASREANMIYKNILSQSADWSGIREITENSTMYAQSFIIVSNPFIMPASMIWVSSLNSGAVFLFLWPLQAVLTDEMSLFIITKTIIAIADGAYRQNSIFKVHDAIFSWFMIV